MARRGDVRRARRVRSARSASASRSASRARASRSFLFRVAFHTTNDRVRALAIGDPRARVQLHGVVGAAADVRARAARACSCSRSRCRSRSSGATRGSSSRSLMWLWVNVHGTFSLGLRCTSSCTSSAAGSTARRRCGGESATSSIGTAIAAVLVFVNPYGPSLVLFPLALMGRSRVLSNVGEWQSVDLHTPTGLPLRVLARSSRVVALARSKPRRGDLLVSIVFLLLGWWAVRNVAIAVAVTIPIVGRAFRPRPRPSPPSADATAHAGARRAGGARRRAARRPSRRRSPTST